MDRLYDKLIAYSASDFYGFHMPGHKRQKLTGAGLPYEIDITEIEGFDDLHHARGVLKEAQERAGTLYGAETRFLVNGSTAGVLAGVLGCTCRGDEILMARNCHKSAYHAVTLQGLKSRYLYPKYDKELGIYTEIRPEDVREFLSGNSGIRAVLIVSPTYDGVISDIRAIADAAHEYGIPLIVDEAHGAHLGMHPYFYGGAIAAGADVVIHSIHKTLPSLTQTALLHVQGNLADREKIYRHLDMLQSSSPSYVLMASIDACINLLEGEKDQLFDAYVERLEKARGRLRELKNLRLVETEHYDRSKIVISVNDTGLSGADLDRILRDRYHLEMEMAAGGYVVAMTSIADTDEGFLRLVRALEEIDRELWTDRIYGRVFGELPPADQVYSIAEAYDRKEKSGHRAIPLSESAGYVSSQYAYLYPPGCPLVVPGERITQEIINLLKAYQSEGFRVEGLSGGFSVQSD